MLPVPALLIRKRLGPFACGDHSTKRFVDNLIAVSVARRQPHSHTSRLAVIARDRASAPFPGYALVEQPAFDAIKSSRPGLLPHHSSRSSTTPTHDWLYLYIQILYKLRCGGAPRRITRRTPSAATPIPVTSASRSAPRQRCTDRCDRSTAGVRHHHARRGCRPRGDSPLSAAPVTVARVPAGNGGHDGYIRHRSRGIARRRTRPQGCPDAPMHRIMTRDRPIRALPDGSDTRGRKSEGGFIWPQT